MSPRFPLRRIVPALRRRAGMRDHSVRPLFPLGEVWATRGAREEMERFGIDGGSLLDRHVTGDWGELCDGHRDDNERALATGGELFSAYGDASRGWCIWIITEPDRSLTTMLIPEDFI